MSKQLLVTIWLLFANYCTKGDVHEMLAATPFSSKSYLPPPAKDHHSEKPQLNLKDRRETTKTALHYIHNQPKGIDDPLPLKEDCVTALDLDFKTDKPETVFKGALLTGLLFNVYEKPLFRAKPAHESPASHVVVEPVKHHQTKTEAENKFKSSDHNVKAESSVESNTYVKNPAEVDVVPINFFAGHATKFRLFNHDDDIELSGSAPVVIFKPGDDIAFLRDTTVIDDYEHTFTEEEYNKAKKSDSKEKKEVLKSPAKATTKPSPKNQVTEHKNEYSATAAASRTLYSQTSVDSHPSAATQHLVTHDQTSESNHSGHGYIYDKPKIPFTS